VLFDERRSGASPPSASFLRTRFRRLLFQPDRRSPAEGPSPDYGYLVRPDAAVQAGNSAELLPDADQVLSAMQAAIGGARRSVDVEMYTFASDTVGRRFARALAERALEGIRVRVLVDAAGCRQTPRSFFGWMREHGVQVRGVNPLRHYLLRGALFRWRDHRKLVVVDDAAAFVGGLNLSRDYAPLREGGGGWKDAAIRVQGPVVDTLSASFEKVWRDGSRGTAPAAPAASPPAGDVPAMLLQSHPVGPGPFAAVFRHAVNQARRRIWIANPYFLPPRSFRKALRRAAQRGVDVRLLLPGRSDSPIVLRASQRSYASYLRSGIRLFEWPGAMMHSKAAVVDGLWSTIGSYNIDPLSLLVNRELNLVLLGGSTGRAFEAMFEADFARSGPIDAERWKKRGAWRRLQENLCGSFRILL
jgi:cardiolipin synthase